MNYLRKGTEKLTAINVLGSLLGLCAGTVLSVRLRSKTSLWTSLVKIAFVVHSLLKGVTFPAKDVVAMGCGTTVRNLISILGSDPFISSDKHTQGS